MTRVVGAFAQHQSQLRLSLTSFRGKPALVDLGVLVEDARFGYLGRVHPQSGRSSVSSSGVNAGRPILALVAAALSWDGYSFSVALIGMEVASTVVLHATAFAALVQSGGQGAQRSITPLTLIGLECR